MGMLRVAQAYPGGTVVSRGHQNAAEIIAKFGLIPRLVKRLLALIDQGAPDR